MNTGNDKFLDCIATSDNPEVFIDVNSIQEIKDNKDINYIELIVTNTDIEDETVFVNSLMVLSEQTNLNIFAIDNTNTNKEINIFHIYFNINNDLDLKFNIKCYHKDSNDNKRLIKEYKNNTVYYKTTSINIGKVNNIGNPINDNNASFMVLRTNPKLTGNIKLVVDSENKIYLDTFKASSILSDRKYRKQEISGNTTFGNDIYNVFKDLPKGELYKLNSENYSTHNLITDFDRMYDHTYNYGAANNTDELYPENFTILAPLWLNKKLPDFFAVFKLPEDIYNGNNISNKNINSDSIFKNMLRDGKLVKLYDMRESSVLGKYLKKHLNEIEYIPGSVYLQFKEQELKQNNIQGENSWTGIAVDKGIITTRKETSYISNKILSNPSGRQEKFNMFLINGFERNNLISSNLINLEFKFNDIDSELFKMNRYFGLYLTENQFLEYKYVASDQNNEIQKFDNDGNIIDDSFLDEDDNIFDNTEFNDRLMFALSPKEGDRLKSKSDIVNFLNTNIINKPYKNVINTPIKKFIKQDKFKEFITININSPINAGEHLRFIIPEYTYQQNMGSEFNMEAGMNNIDNNIVTIKRPLIIELIASNDIRLKAKNYTNFTDRMICNMPDSKYYQYDLDGTELDLVYDKIDEPIIYRVPFYVHSVNNGTFYNNNSDVINDESILLLEETIDNQLDRIITIIDELKFEGINLGIINYNKDKGFISIGSNYDKTYFQRISAYVYGEELHSKELNDWKNIVQDSITVFSKESRIKPTLYKLDNTNKKTIKHNDNLFKYLIPDSFESYGNRYQYTVNFAKYNILYEIKLPTDLSLDLVTLYRDINNKFKYINIFNINSYIQKENNNILTHHIDTYRLNNIQSPYNPDMVVIDCPNQAMYENGVINLYSSKPVQLSVMGMLPIKDFHYLDYNDINYRLSDSDLIKLKVKKGNKIYIGNNSNSEYVIPENNIFKITKGSLYGINFKTNDRVFTTFKNEIDSELFTNIKSGSIISVSSDVEITMFNIMNIKTKDDEIINIKKMDITKFYEDINSGILLEPVITPTVSYWEMIGTDYNNINAPLLTNNIIKPIDNNKRNIGIPSYNFIGKSNSPHALSINNIVEYNGDVYNYKDYILYSGANNTINKLIGNTNKFNAAIGYYNKNTETFEFIISGLKFNLRLNADQKDDNINLAVYNNYNVFLINSTCDNKTNNSDFDIIIKTDERAIIIINYKFDFFNNLYKQNIMVNKESNIIYKNNDFYFDFNDITFDNEYTYLKYYNGKPTLFNDNISGISAQFNLTNSGNKFIDKVKNYGFYMLMDKWSENDNLILNNNYLKYRHESVIRIMNNFYNKNGRDGAIYKNNIIYNPSSDTIINKSLSYFLMDKENYLKYIKSKPLMRVYTEDNLKYDINNKNITLYIKTDDSVNIINMDSIDKKLLIDIEYPNNTGYNYGYFTPRFIDIVEYYNKDVNVNKAIKCDFDFCNTKFKSIKNINLYYNKIFNNNKHDITKGTSISKFDNISLVSATWDNNYYRLYTDLNNYIDIQGFNTGVETKSFFSSKGIVIKNNHNDGSIILSNWNAPNVVTTEYKNVQEYDTTQKSVNFDTLEIKFNLTLAFYNFFSKNKTFVNNWKPFKYDVNSINNYIKYTMFKYYKIDNKTDFKLYYKFEYSPENHLEKTQPDEYEFKTKYKQINNINSDITFENNNYYCTIKISDYKNKVFYATFDVKRNII